MAIAAQSLPEAGVYFEEQKQTPGTFSSMRVTRMFRKK
jgi:hypothetical protein